MQRRMFMFAPLIAALPFRRVQSGATPVASPESTAATDNGLVSVESAYSVAETMDRLEAAMEEAGLIVVARVDHAANAENAGLDLRPTQLLIFGNPELGTQLMQSNQSIGIDLPQKFLGWEDADGTVHLTYNDPVFIAQRHDIDDRDEVIQKVAKALAMLAEGATT